MVCQEVLNTQSVKIRSMQRLATSIEPTITLYLVTNAVKLMEGTYQAATKVKVLSPEMPDIVEADVFMRAESSTKVDVKASRHSLYRGLRPLHDMRWVLGKLGRSFVFLKGYAMTSQQRRGLANDTKEVGLIDSTRSIGKLCTWGSGQQYSDGLSTCPQLHRGKNADEG